MSPPIKPNSDVKASTELLLSSTLDLDQQQQEKVSGSSSSWNTSSNSNPFFTNSLQNYNNNNSISKAEEITSSDEDMFTVPEVEAEPGISSGITLDNKDHNLNANSQTEFTGHKRRRGRNPIDKEYRRLKRLLRNRVSAQQARERKKVYVNDLESRAQELQETNSKLEEKISTLINENNMLRKVLINTRPKVDDSIEPKQDKLSKK